MCFCSDCGDWGNVDLTLQLMAFFVCLKVSFFFFPFLFFHPSVKSQLFESCTPTPDESICFQSVRVLQSTKDEALLFKAYTGIYEKHFTLQMGKHDIGAGHNILT